MRSNSMHNEIILDALSPEGAGQQLILVCRRRFFPKISKSFETESQQYRIITYIIYDTLSQGLKFRSNKM